MKDLSNLETLTSKKLRNLRMNLNNRIETFTYSVKPKELQASHMLFGLSEKECHDLLSKVKRAEKVVAGKTTL